MYSVCVCGLCAAAVLKSDVVAVDVVVSQVYVSGTLVCQHDRARHNQPQQKAFAKRDNFCQYYCYCCYTTATSTTATDAPPLSVVRAPDIDQ
jgi:hypothetical protein